MNTVSPSKLTCDNNSKLSAASHSALSVPHKAESCKVVRLEQRAEASSVFIKSLQPLEALKANKVYKKKGAPNKIATICHKTVPSREPTTPRIIALPISPRKQTTALNTTFTWWDGTFAQKS